MTKNELISEIAAEHGLTKVKAGEIVVQVFGAIGATLKKEGRFAFPDVGTFTVRERAARKGRNPKTGEALKIKATKSVGFKPAPSLKLAVAKFKVVKK